MFGNYVVVKKYDFKLRFKLFSETANIVPIYPGLCWEVCCCETVWFQFEAFKAKVHNQPKT